MRFVLATCALALAACSSSSSSSSSSGAVPPPPGSDAGAPTTAMTVWVFDRGPDLPPAPLAGATVAVDPEGADRVEATSGPDGKAVVNADFSKGRATVTIAAPDHAPVTLFAVRPNTPSPLGQTFFDKPATDVVVNLFQTTAAVDARTVKLSGSIVNKLAAGDRVNLNPNRVGTLFDDTHGSYTLRAPKGKPFLLLGSEYTFTQTSRSAQATIGKFFELQHDALAADTTLDIDIAAAPAVQTVTNKIHVALPGGASGPFGAQGFARVNVLDAFGVVFPGVLQKSALSPDGNGFDCEVTVAQVDVGAPLVTNAVIQNPDGSATVHSELGVVADGSAIDGFLAPTASTIASAKASDTFDVSGAPSDGTVVEVVLRDVSGAPLWAGFVPIGNGAPTSVKMPALPTGATLGTPFDGVFVALGELTKLDDGGPYWKRASYSAPFTVTK